jgi:hypothetical protein
MSATILIAISTKRDVIVIVRPASFYRYDLLRDLDHQ